MSDLGSVPVTTATPIATPETPPVPTGVTAGASSTVYVKPNPAERLNALREAHRKHNILDVDLLFLLLEEMVGGK